uniref:Mitochondrial assembly of ribosomal large subunit protein 1 n=1 Tax=Rhipicephalus zambeziensis TaxID=60191 RepID=A0A224YMU6_9ACAR
MGSQMVLTTLFRVGGLGMRQMGYRVADVHYDQLCQRLANQAALRRHFSARHSSLRKDDALDSKLENSQSSTKPLLEPDDETRSILNDIWRDFECVPPKPSPAEGGSSGGTPGPAAAPKGDLPKENATDGPRVRSLLHSARANAKMLFADEDSSIILDSAEEQMSDDVDYIPQNIKVDPLEGFNLKRGETGVFEVEELVDILREEKLSDIAVITVPKEMAYADYLVLATAISPRQAQGVTEFLRKLYKRKKDSTDPNLVIEGEESADWKVLDMGNVVLHVFLAEARRHYDVETLWTVGSRYDDLTHAKDDPVYNLLQQQIQLMQEMQPKELDDRCALQS